MDGNARWRSTGRDSATGAPVPKPRIVRTGVAWLRAMRLLQCRMRIAFYAPLKAPTHEISSGDRRVARLLMQALRLAGHNAELVSDLRAFDGAGDATRQRHLRDADLDVARTSIARGRAQVESMLREAACGRVQFSGRLRRTHDGGRVCGGRSVHLAGGQRGLRHGDARGPGRRDGVCVLCHAGVPDVVQDGITGLLAPSHDPQALAACARSLLSDLPRRRAMGQAASRFVPHRRSLEQTATTLRELLAPWQPQVDTTGVVAATP